MVVFDATEQLTPFHDARGQGAILFDATQLRQVDPRWFDPAEWGARARAVRGSGRGGAWYVDASHGPCVLRHYLRGGWAAAVSRDRHLWRGAGRVRSFHEFRLLRELLRHELPVPRPIAASYLRTGPTYRAAILLERLTGVHSLAELAAESLQAAPWQAAGYLIARFHRAGLDHADLNAHNLLFGDDGQGWLIDLDRGQLRIPATGWRSRNLARLQRSLRKLQGAAADAGFAQLREAYDAEWARGV